MPNDNQRLPAPARDVAPCKGCTEKFAACHDRCPKDLHGEYGYKAFRERIDRANTARKEYIDHKYNNYRRRN